jgi:cardiolipin synthase
MFMVIGFIGCASTPCQKETAKGGPKVTILTNRDFFPAVHEIFQKAEKSIRVMVFSARYYTEKPTFAGDIEREPGMPWSDTNILLSDLVNAKERGVDVLMIMDKSNWNESNTELNEQFGRRLVEEDVAVYMDDPEVTTHTKLILVDDHLTVVGSTNWSYYALDTNNETSVLIESKEINKTYQDLIAEVLAASTPLSIEEGN